MLKNHQDLQRLYMQMCVALNRLGVHIHCDEFRKTVTQKLDERIQFIVNQDIHERIKDLKYEELVELKNIIKATGKPKGAGSAKRGSRKTSFQSQTH